MVSCILQEYNQIHSCLVSHEYMHLTRLRIYFMTAWRTNPATLATDTLPSRSRRASPAGKKANFRYCKLSSKKYITNYPCRCCASPAGTVNTGTSNSHINQLFILPGNQRHFHGLKKKKKVEDNEAIAGNSRQVSIMWRLSHKRCSCTEGPKAWCLCIGF